MKVLRNLPNPDEIKNEFPISEKAKKIKAEKEKIDEKKLCRYMGK